MPLRKKRIGIIGAGNMGEALLKGLQVSGCLNAKQVFVSAKHQKRLDHLSQTYHVKTMLDNKEVVRHAEILILAVKPQIIHGVLGELSAGVFQNSKNSDDRKLVISVVAGLSTSTIARYIGEKMPIIRTMPNTPALVMEAATAICLGKNATEEDLSLAQQLFSTFGKTVIVDEEQMNAVTGLSGCGPAYVFLMIEAMADAGVKVGLSRAEAQTLAAQTVLGSAKLLLETGAHPGHLKDMVTSPGGAAIAGVAKLEEGGFRTTLIRAVEAATQRCVELGVLAEKRTEHSSN